MTMSDRQCHEAPAPSLADLDPTDRRILAAVAGAYAVANACATAHAPANAVAPAIACAYAITSRHGITPCHRRKRYGAGTQGLAPAPDGAHTRTHQECPRGASTPRGLTTGGAAPMDALTLPAFPPRRQVRDAISPVTLRLTEPDATALLEVLLGLLGAYNDEHVMACVLSATCQLQGALRGRP